MLCRLHGAKHFPEPWRLTWHLKLWPSLVQVVACHLFSIFKMPSAKWRSFCPDRFVSINGHGVIQGWCGHVTIVMFIKVIHWLVWVSIELQSRHHIKIGRRKTLTEQYHLNWLWDLDKNIIYFLSKPPSSGCVFVNYVCAGERTELMPWSSDVIWHRWSL